MTEPDLSAEPALALTPVEPGYRSVLRLQWALLMAPLAIGAVLVDVLVVRAEGWSWGFLSVASLLIGAIMVVQAPQRSYSHWGYAMGPDSLRVARGFLFHTDTIVPFVRVQHIDVGQGPIERMCGVVQLVVHTAGTHNSIVTLPGLAPETAAEMRDAIRRHIQTDFA